MSQPEAVIVMSDELYHYGTKGMKWYIRNYQYPDGSLTPAGRLRYNKGDKQARELINNLNEYNDKLTNKYIKSSRLQKEGTAGDYIYGKEYMDRFMSAHASKSVSSITDADTKEAESKVNKILKDDGDTPVKIMMDNLNDFENSRINKTETSSREEPQNKSETKTESTNKSEAKTESSIKDRPDPPKYTTLDPSKKASDYSDVELKDIVTRAAQEANYKKQMDQLYPKKKESDTYNSYKSIANDSSKAARDAASLLRTVDRYQKGMSKKEARKFNRKIKHMSDEEINAAINRINLETRYKQAMGAPVTVSGKEKAARILETAGGIAGITATSLGIVSTIKKLKE